jgi:trans-aconitate 2-methyltransferase
VSESLLREQTFSANAERSDQVVAAVLELLPAGEPRRVLEIGCGTGESLLALAAARPHASFVGVDVSERNVAAAERARDGHPAAERLEFVAADYAATTLDGPFDVVFADQSLHLVSAPTSELCARLAADVAPDGVLVAEMAHRGAYNTAMVAARRMLRRVRGPRLDRAALAVARRLHKGTMREEQLRERIAYLYVVPARLAGPAWEDELAKHGLVRLDRRPMRHASPAQLRHDLRVYARTARCG